MNRFAICALAVIAIMANAPSMAVEKPPRFSLLAHALDPANCLLRPDSAVDYLASENPVDGCVLLTVPPLADFSDRQPVLTGTTLETDDTSQAEDDGPGFALSDRWRAAVSYHHELLFPTATSRDLRMRRFSLFSAEQDRDVLDLRLSWSVSKLSAIDFGYQLQSNRASLSGAAEAYSVRRFVTDADLDYALTIGITRRFNSGR